jgi:ADP-L-glycero-D-manno-heptose 6-epimerase
MSASTQKTYLVTGAAGFIGARWIESCQQRGISIISVDQQALFHSRQEHSNLDFGQIIDRDALPVALPQLVPVDAIIHLGAITDTRESDLSLLQRFNLEYSQWLWSYAVQARIPFIYASSAATYGDGQLGFSDDENLMDRLQPLNPYGLSKLQFDLWVLNQEKRNQSPPHWAGFKFFNVYGFGERHKNFMASVVLHAFDEIQKTGKVTLFKSHKPDIPDGFQSRDFIFVGDIVETIHFALQRPISRGIYNLGTGKARTFLDLVRAVFSSLGQAERIEFIDTPLSVRDRYQYFTEAKMQKLVQLGFQRPMTELEVGVQATIQRLLAAQAR